MTLETDKQRRERQLDELAFEVLAARHIGPESWMRWSAWFELTKAKQGDRGLGNTTFSDCIRRLLDQGRIRRCLIAKNRFYQVIFTPGSSSGAISSKPPASDKATQALTHLLSRKSSGVV
jgi:hypothetical protein